MWRVQASKYQKGPIEYIEICCLVVALINMEAKIIFIGPPPVPRWSQKWVALSPHTSGCAAHDLDERPVFVALLISILTDLKTSKLRPLTSPVAALAIRNWGVYIALHLRF